ncbi:hypothetical protein [Leptothoe spongobia]|uniref:Uncharacterized protein n=1 Tax=Leptothoe spongobia TAU-MAC 1115 TaxID=1967444 RepID=A0A947GKU1_9CYAN|nr:hypothetical protein [Leptothoe spongobia]MBT9317950.1 hypothetical protein [Leptothoe spongobia TAU-MAC 1115]
MTDDLDKTVTDSSSTEPVADTDEAAKVDLDKATKVEDSPETPDQSDTPAVPPLVVVEEPEVIDDDGRTPGITEKISK